MGIYIDRKDIDEIIQKRDSLLSKCVEEKCPIQSTNSLSDKHENCYFYELEFGNNVCLGGIVTYKNIRFFQCKFTKCKFIRCIFQNCRFIDCDFRDCSFSDVTFVACAVFDYFCNCTFSKIIFNNCDCQFAIFTNSKFVEVKAVKSDMGGLIWYRCSAKGLTINRSIFCGAKLIELGKLSFDNVDYDQVTFDRNTVFEYSENVIDSVGFLGSDYELKQIFRERFLTMYKVSDIFRNLGYTDLSWEYYYIGKKNEKNSLTGISWVMSSFTDILCGYGERPSHTFICIVLNILLFGLLYLISGFAIGDRIISLSAIQATFPQNFIEVFKLYCHSVFFSITTFSTVGYGNYVPVGPISSTLAAIQMLMGVSLTALWTGCIFRKISR